VTGEEGGVGGRVVVVEQLEQIGEAAFLTAAGLAAEARIAVGGHRPIPAVGTDEVVLVGHRRPRIETHDARHPGKRRPRALVQHPPLRAAIPVPAATVPGAHTRAGWRPFPAVSARSGHVAADMAPTTPPSCPPFPPRRPA